MLVHGIFNEVNKCSRVLGMNNTNLYINYWLYRFFNILNTSAKIGLSSFTYISFHTKKNIIYLL